MTRTRFLALAGLAALLPACTGDRSGGGSGGGGGDTVDSADPDGDGLDRDAEAALGTDPEVADTDGDGLDDGAEVDAGTDPLAADSDDDGYTDGEEVAAGTNPLYYYSHPYTGGYHVGDCSEAEPTPTGPTGTASYDSYTWSYYQEGDVAENFTLTDQYGEEVDLWSFCGNNVMIVFGAFW